MVLEFFNLLTIFYRWIRIRDSDSNQDKMRNPDPIKSFGSATLLTRTLDKNIHVQLYIVQYTVVLDSGLCY